MTRNAPILFAGLLLAGPAAAQDNAVRGASDAFGERVGTEQAGLYTETQVRGFDLNDSGGYRIDEAYFSRAAVLDDTILAGVGVRVGVSATSLAYPAPSGVVNYRLREAGPGNEMRITAGLRDFGTKVVQGDVSLRSGNFSLAGGWQWRPTIGLAQGYRGEGVNVGAVGAWQVSPDHRLRAFASLYERHYDGDYTVAAADPAVPPSLKPLHQYSPDWARTRATSSNVGMLYEGKIGGFRLGLAAFRSLFLLHSNDYTIITADREGRASATLFRYPDRPKRSLSFEGRLDRRFSLTGLDHLVTVSLRRGQMRSHLATATAVPLGTFELPGDPPEAEEIEWSGTRGLDKVRQDIASLSYRMAWKDRVQLAFGVHRATYDKSVLTTAGTRSERVSTTLHYNASAVVGLTKTTSLYASWVTGLEESGVAPGTATNRDEILPPVETEQRELGIRHALTPKLTLIGALFDVSKPRPGMRQDGSYGLVGEVRHRGIEGSIAGDLDPRTRAVIGIVAFRAKVSGPLVEAGLVGRNAAGISNIVINANVDRQLGQGRSVDAGFSYLGERWADTANRFKAPAVATVSLGARQRFTLGGRPAELRILGSNLIGRKGYLVAPSGLFAPIAPRTFRATLTLSFGPRD